MNGNKPVEQDWLVRSSIAPHGQGLKPATALSLGVHPAVDTVLRYLSRKIDWTLVGVDERWRDGFKVIYRKTPAKAA